MFYANIVLSKKGPLARVWLAAHWEKKLSKAHVFETDLQSSVDNIIAPKVKIALRTSGHLLLGVVRIYSRKAKYLLADCTEALIKIKMAFRPDVVDLPLDNQKAAISAITLPELQEWDAMVNNLGNFDINTFNNNVCRVEDITMKEDLISSRFLSDDNFFGDTPFGEVSEILREDSSFHDSSTVALGEISKTIPIQEDETTESAMNDPMMGGSGFGAGEGLDFLEGFGMDKIKEVAGTVDLDTGHKLDDTLIDNMLDNMMMPGMEEIGAIPAENLLASDDDEPISEQVHDDLDEEENEPVAEEEPVLFSCEVPSVLPSEGLLQETTFPQQETTLPLQETTLPLQETIFPVQETTFPLQETTFPQQETTSPQQETTIPQQETILPQQETTYPQEEPTYQQEETTYLQQEEITYPQEETNAEAMTTLFSRDAEALNLEPIEVMDKGKKAKKRKRKLVVDQDKIILNDAMKQQISNDEDIIKTAVVAPPTRTRLMLLESSTRSCFTQPPIIPSKIRRLCKMYDLHMTLEQPEDFTLPSSQDYEVQLEQVSDVLQNIEEIPPELQEEMIDIAEKAEEEKTEVEEEKKAEAEEDDELNETIHPEEEEEEEGDENRLHPDYEMKEIEEELMNEEGIQIAPAFELETIEKKVDEEPEDDGLYIRYNEEEEEDDEDDINVENKRWTKRTHQTLKTLSKGLKKKQHPISFRDLTAKSNRKQAAYTFYTLLILRKEQAIDVQQTQVFGEITIDRGTKFNSHV